MIKVSILTPIFGVEKYIEQCVRSLFEQSYASIEYIFVDDCTPDRSIDILQSLLKAYPNRAKQARIIHHDKNRGVGAARQTALMTATGDYIFFADSDDLLPRDAVELLVKKAESTHADLIDGAYREWSNGKASELQKPFDGDEEKDVKQNEEKDVKQNEGKDVNHGESYLSKEKSMGSPKMLKLLVCQNIITNRLWGRIYKRSLIMEHQIFFEEGINYAEDLFWNAQFLFYGKKVSINDAVYYYRTDNESSYNHNISEKNLLSYFKSTHRLIDFFEKHDTAHHYRRATEIGIVNAYRWAANAHVSLEKVDKDLDYKPKSLLIRLIIRLIKKGVSIKRVNLIYLSYRRIYTTFI